VVPIPGPAALTAALSAAGLDLPRFLFEGFLPARGGARRDRLRELAATGLPFVLYEAPHRIRETLVDLAAEAGGRRAVLAREVTKLHEEFLRGTAEELAERMGTVEPRGEMTVVVEGGPAAEPGTRLAVELAKAVALVRESGVGASRGAALLAALTGADRKELYRKLSEEE
jgi:16S rRNA (cytidine1402-2'-O)-methyltransferase